MDYIEKADTMVSDAKYHNDLGLSQNEAVEIVQIALLMEIRDGLEELNTTSDSTKSLIQWIKEWWEENSWTPRF